MMFMFGGDPAYDATRLVVRPLHGCVVGELIPLPQTSEIVYFLDLGEPVAVGQTASVGYRIEMEQARYSADELASRGIEQGLVDSADCTIRRQIPHLVINVEFQGCEPPSKIWQTRGEGEDRVAVRELSLGAFGSVHVVESNAEPGIHGIAWDWE